MACLSYLTFTSDTHSALVFCARKRVPTTGTFAHSFPPRRSHVKKGQGVLQANAKKARATYICFHFLFGFIKVAWRWAATQRQRKTFVRHKHGQALRRFLSSLVAMTLRMTQKRACSRSYFVTKFIHVCKHITCATRNSRLLNVFQAPLSLLKRYAPHLCVYFRIRATLRATLPLRRRCFAKQSRLCASTHPYASPLLRSYVLSIPTRACGHARYMLHDTLSLTAKPCRCILLHRTFRSARIAVFSRTSMKKMDTSFLWPNSSLPSVRGAAQALVTCAWVIAQSLFSLLKIRVAP